LNVMKNKKAKFTASEQKQLQPFLVDCHVHLAEDDAWVYQKFLPSLYPIKFCCVSACQKQWEIVKNAKTVNPYSIIPAFGIHPWQAHKAGDPAIWLPIMQQYVENTPDSIVGEIGLDKACKSGGKVEWDIQVTVFTEQFLMAAKLKKPINMHCVRAFGFIHDFFKNWTTKYPELEFPQVIFHSYSGSPDMINSYLKIPSIGDKLYFSFSEVINMRAETKTIAAIQKVPEERLLIESDHISHGIAYCNMLSILDIVANARGWTRDYTAKLTTNNAKIFFAHAKSVFP